MEPRWKTFLNWAAVITWFALPILFFLVQLLSAADWMQWLHFKENAGQGQYKWLATYYGDLTILVFGLSGMQLIDKKFSDRK